MNEIDTAEIRLLRAIIELNNRIIIGATTPEQRAILRGSIENLRRELISLVESIPIYSEGRCSRGAAASTMAFLDDDREGLAMATRSHHQNRDAAAVTSLRRQLGITQQSSVWRGFWVFTRRP